MAIVIPMRLMTYNIRKGLGANGRSNMVAALGEALKEQELDVLLCQEVFHPWEAHGQSVLIEHSTGLTSHYHANKHRKVGHHGNCLFARTGFHNVQNYDVSTNALERRSALYGCLHLPHKRVHVFNVHLGLNQRQRLKQIEQVGRLIHRYAKDTDGVLLAGDFNDWNGRIDRYAREHLELQNAFTSPPKTWPTRRPIFNLDRVYTKNLTVQSATCLTGEPWEVLSDHLPLLVDLR